MSQIDYFLQVEFIFLFYLIFGRKWKQTKLTSCRIQIIAEMIKLSSILKSIYHSAIKRASMDRKSENFEHIIFQISEIIILRPYL